MGFVRCILGDVEVDELGVCDAHEHLIIDGEFIEEKYPEFLLCDVDVIVEGLVEFKELGGGWVVDTMPTGPGRNVEKVAEVSRRSNVPVVCPTGMHLGQYYLDDHAMMKMGRDEFVRLFAGEIENGMVAVHGKMTEYRAGVIKVAGSYEKLTDLEREVFCAAGYVSARTGCPIITHTEQGTAGVEQVEILKGQGVDLGHVVLSHCDRVKDEGYHRALLDMGVRLEYDNHFRELLNGEQSYSIDLIAELCVDYPEQLVVGMDLARRSYWRGYDGGPGVGWLVAELPRILRQKGVEEIYIDRILNRNALDVFSFYQPVACR
ncbi:aryldialkylphosphatase [Planctomycetota bacterium]|nr:aryldialkylphosphatase [Planctomycetota bacterium]